MQHTAYET